MIIKISCHDTTASWSDHRNPMIFKFLPNRENLWNGCEFFWNDESVKQADYWVIIGDVDLLEESCEVAPENVIFMTGEPQSVRRYDNSREFVGQFGRIFTSQHDFRHEKVFPMRPPLNWWIDSGNPIKTREEFAQWQGDGLSYDDFKALREIRKDKVLSVFCSNKVFTEGHRARFNFCQELKKYFKDKIDWFGNGVMPLANKWHGIAPYKYHIVLENFRGPDYWTEKLIDPLMVLTHPIYCGATNIAKYFSNQQVTEIDVCHPKFAIARIEKIIEENFYEKNFDQLLAARNLVMDKYNFFNLISEIVANDKKLEPVLKPTAPRFSINFGSFFGKIFCSMPDTAAKFCQKVAQNLWKIETRWVLRQALAKSVANKVKIIIRKEDFFLLQTVVSSKNCRKNLFQRLQRSLVKKFVKAKNFFTDFFLLTKFRLITK